MQQKGQQQELDFGPRRNGCGRRRKLSKHAVDPGFTWNGDHYALAVPDAFAAAFIEFIRPQSIFETLATQFRRVPLNTKIPRQTAASSVSWVGQGGCVQTSPLSYDNVQIGTTKVAGIIALSRELVRLGTPDASRLIRDELASVVSTFLDISFLDPTRAAVTDLNPGMVLR